eukprot:gene30373-35379_t
MVDTLSEQAIAAKTERELENDAADQSRRYSKHELIGQGAQKKVYKAFDEEEGIEVAWNEVAVGELAWRTEKERSKLFAEIRVLKQLKHKNIMTLKHWWFDPKSRCICFITELFTDGTLRQYRRKHKNVDTLVIKRWAWQILQGLVYLHGHNPPIIHRDLKSDNIFVNGSAGVVKIGDLGFATMRAGLSTAMSVIGTPEFMAPELYEEQYNEKVDVYSFGLCLLELVTLEYPYAECRNPAQIFKKVTQGIPPAGLEKVVDDEFRTFISMCITHDHESRPEARQLLKHPFFDFVRSAGGANGKVQLNSNNSYGQNLNSVTSHAQPSDTASLSNLVAYPTSTAPAPVALPPDAPQGLAVAPTSPTPGGMPLGVPPPSPHPTVLQHSEWEQGARGAGPPMGGEEVASSRPVDPAATAAAANILNVVAAAAAANSTASMVVSVPHRDPLLWSGDGFNPSPVMNPSSSESKPTELNLHADQPPPGEGEGDLAEEDVLFDGPNGFEFSPSPQRSGPVQGDSDGEGVGLSSPPPLSAVGLFKGIAMVKEVPVSKSHVPHPQSFVLFPLVAAAAILMVPVSTSHVLIPKSPEVRPSHQRSVLSPRSPECIPTSPRAFAEAETSSSTFPRGGAVVEQRLALAPLLTVALSRLWVFKQKLDDGPYELNTLSVVPVSKSHVPTPTFPESPEFIPTCPNALAEAEASDSSNPHGGAVSVGIDINQQQRLRLNCRNNKQDEAMLSFSMSFVNHNGTRKKVGFLYNLDEDEPHDIAHEMVENLSLNVEEADFIASMIQREVFQLSQDKASGGLARSLRVDVGPQGGAQTVTQQSDHAELENGILQVHLQDSVFPPRVQLPDPTPMPASASTHAPASVPAPQADPTHTRAPAPTSATEPALALERVQSEFAEAGQLAPPPSPLPEDWGLEHLLCNRTSTRPSTRTPCPQKSKAALGGWPGDCWVRSSCALAPAPVPGPAAPKEQGSFGGMVHDMEKDLSCFF